MNFAHHKKSSFIAGLCAAVTMLFFCSCSTPDFSLPDGFDHNATKDKIDVSFDTLEVSGLDSSIINSALRNQLESVILGKFISCKRFNVIKDQSLLGRQKYDVNVKPFINFNTWPGERVMGCKCATVLSTKFANAREGIYEEALDLQGVFPSRKDGDKQDLQYFNVVYGQARLSGGDVTTMVTQSYTRAYRVLTEEIERRYPITARATFKNIGSKTEFHLDIGTDWGLDKNHDVLVYALDDEKNVTVVALTKPSVGKEITQLQVTAWNFDNPEVKELIYPRIRQNDKTLKLYAVARRIADR